MILLYTFKTISAALDAEQAFKNAPFSCKVIPMPRALGVSCNYAITVESDTVADEAAGVEYEKVFRCTGEAYEEIID
ncbi:hypothetical protein AGMMS49940_14270 [Spirochaetia bacterium]|nr:hypothetical protein AGMMS49940_14270 [Spirochaetia bacterium]